MLARDERRSAAIAAAGRLNVMPEVPDVLLHIGALESRIRDQRLERVRITSPFVLRTVSPPISRLEGKRVAHLTRLGKHIVLGSGIGNAYSERTLDEWDEHFHVRRVREVRRIRGTN